MKYEFGSREWLHAVEEILEAIVAESELDESTEFTFCEVYTDVPARISGTGRVAWHTRLQDGVLTFVGSEADDADVKIVVDWATAARLASFEYADMPADAGEAMQLGRVSVTFGKNPAPPAFAAAHDRIARITL